METFSENETIYTDEVQDTFDNYFEDVIEPLVEQENAIKQKYRSRFWAFFWSISFFICINALIALFNAVMHQHPFNWELLLLVSGIAFIFVFFPIFSYYRREKEDVFDVFLRFYNSWIHQKNKEVRLVHSPIIPKHEKVTATHCVENIYDGVKIEMRDTSYSKILGKDKLKWEYGVSSGVIVYMRFPKNFKDTILLFEKSGFMRKSNFNSQSSKTHIFNVPAAYYFNIFGSDEHYMKDFLRISFFETLLNLKDTFKAKHVYVEFSEDYARIYFEGSKLYVDTYKFWSKKIDKKKFHQLNEMFNGVMELVDVINHQIRSFDD